MRGVGLHSGKPTTVKFYPNHPDSGAVFHRVDKNNKDTIRAIYDNVSSTDFATKLSENTCSVTTVEHLLSALFGCAIDNIIIEVDSEEIPILDGSSSVFVGMFQAAGVVEQNAPKRYIKIKKPCLVGNDEAWASFEPYDGFQITFTIDFDHPIFALGPQTMEFNYSTADYLEKISQARTFGFTRDLDKMKAQDLAKGGGVSNAIILDDKKVINQEGLRYHDEMLRHKILDAFGDLYLLGGNIIGKFSGYKSGHKLNNALLRRIQQDSLATEIITFP